MEKFTIRVCIVNQRTRQEDLEVLVRECVRIGKSLSDSFFTKKIIMLIFFANFNFYELKKGKFCKKKHIFAQLNNFSF
jgi:hypothetical protein